MAAVIVEQLKIKVKCITGEIKQKKKAAPNCACMQLPLGTCLCIQQKKRSKDVVDASCVACMRQAELAWKKKTHLD
jgi:hypothetical protein